jgi:hypothetical protein
VKNTLHVIGLAIYCLVPALASPAVPAQDETTSCFVTIVQPGGWHLPAYSTMSSEGISSGDVVPAGIHFKKYRVREKFFLPRYYVRDKHLVLLSLRFYTDELTRWDVDGVPFAYTAVVKGADVGIVGSISWVDRDGSGRFEEFQWNPPTSNVPGWALDKLKKHAAAAGPPGPK